MKYIKLKFTLFVAIAFLIIGASSSSAATFTVDIVGAEAYDLSGFTLYLDGGTFTSSNLLYGDAVPAGWFADTPSNSHFGSSDFMGNAFGSPTAYMTSGNLLTFDYTGALPVAPSFVSLVDFFNYDLYLDGTFSITSYSSTGMTLSSAVPVPGAAWLLGSGLLGLVGLRRKKA